MYKLSHSHRAFSLVELSIVLVILGLLVGGVLSGQSLIRAAEVRSVISEYQKYTAAVNMFRDKYTALPGDMANATKFWDTASSSACATTGSSGRATCDGNGDGAIWNTDSSFEIYRAWQHLANAGLIEGAYTGVGGTSKTDNSLRQAGVTNPQAKVTSRALWEISTDNTAYTGSVHRFDSMVMGTGLDIISTGASGASQVYLKPEEAWTIDKKIDDGKPGQGHVMAPWGQTSGAAAKCTLAADSSDVGADYNLSSAGVNCLLWFPQLF